MPSACRLFCLIPAILLVLGCAGPRIREPGSYFVSDDTVEVRLGPSRSTAVTNRLYRRQRVDVHEIQGSWARISRYYDGRIEDVSGQVARWVPVSALSPDLPAELAQLDVPLDPRIAGLPKVGENGLTRRDVETLYRGAAYFLETGKCRKIEYGDKSTSRRDTYYLNCGPENLFFKEADLPPRSTRR